MDDSIILQSAEEIQLAIKLMSDNEVYLAYDILMQRRRQYQRHTRNVYLDVFFERTGTYENCFDINYTEKQRECFILGNIPFLIIVEAIDNMERFFQGRQYGTKG